MNTTTLPTTREACDELIAQIAKHRDSLPKHPIVGHLYRHKDGEVYIAADTMSNIMLINIHSGARWSHKGGFDGCESEFTHHLGPAADHLQLKSDAPKLPEVTEEMVKRAEIFYRDFEGDIRDSMRHILNLYREGKL